MGKYLERLILAVAIAALSCNAYSETEATNKKATAAQPQASDKGGQAQQDVSDAAKASHAEPVELTFKDLQIGVSTQADFKAVFPFIEGKPFQPSRLPYPGYKPPMIGEDKGAECHNAGDPLGSRDMKWQSEACSYRAPSTTSGGRELLLSPSAKYGGYVNLKSVDASFEDGKLVQLRITLTDPAQYGEILLALTEKFGKPQVESTVVQNKMGASFDQQVATWSSLGKTLTYSKRGYDLTVSGMTLWDDAFHVREVEKFKQKIKDTAKSGL